MANDSAIDWVWNIGILKKKLEFNIGYWRYVQRHVGWQEDVNRIQTAVNLLTIAESDYPNIDGTYLNLRTAERYSREKDSDEEDLHRLYLTKLYRDKAFHILWKWLDHNMKKWWD